MPFNLTRPFSVLMCAVALFGTLGVSSAHAQTQQRYVVYSSLSKDPVRLRRVVGKQNASWINGLGFRFENTSTKPIYFVRLVVILPTVITSTGSPVAIELTFGDSSMGTVTKVAEPEYSFLPPGQSAKLYISSASFVSLAGYLSQSGRTLSDVATAQAFLQQVSFGDGTGYLAGRSIGTGEEIQCPCTRYERTTIQCPAGCPKLHYDSLPASHGDPDAPCGSVRFASRLCWNSDSQMYDPCDDEYIDPCISSGPGIPFPVMNEW